ncbi:class II aldolase/adducin family protein [Candidatus Amarolinea aalborgensis]|uniref:class II aldolase/adducin family protein n=1 Tax=Candidatus Amarolinea aalborgensis TaxID=2249329 RepID=UPI003BFA0CD4
MTEWLEERQRVLQAAQQLLVKRLTVGSSGNVSQRVGDELLAITPNRRYTEDLTPTDIVVATFEGDVVAGEGIPSSELMMHVGVYQARPDVLAVIHAHPRYVSAAAVTGRAIPPILEDQMIYLGGQIEVAGHAMSGSDELAAAAVAALGDRHACLLANHGAMAVGRDLRAALYACEYLEKLCQAFLWASLLGPLNVMPPDVVETERAFFKMMRM